MYLIKLVLGLRTWSGMYSSDNYKGRTPKRFWHFSAKYKSRIMPNIKKPPNIQYSLPDSNAFSDGYPFYKYEML